MTLTAVSRKFDAATFEAFLQSRQEPDWLLDARRDAFEQFASLGAPARNSEEWSRTDVRLLSLDKFSPAGVPAKNAALPRPLLTENVDLAGQLTTLDSHQVSSTLDPALAQQGVLFGSLEQFAQSHSALVQKHFGQQICSGADKFAALHGAFWSGGQLLYVPRNVKIQKPIHMLSAISSGGVDLGRTLIVLDEGAEATILAEAASTDEAGSGLHSGGLEVVVGPRANLRYVTLQNWSTGTWHFAQQKISVDRDAQLQWTVAALGSRLAHVNQTVALVGEGAQAQVNGVMFTEGKQHLAYLTLQHHQAPHCRSDFLYKGALQDTARIVWRGMIKVDKDAQKTDGYQRNDTLMLSEHARSDSIPGLEIEADDVRCTHGSTTGRVDDEQIFYCCSRGLTRKEAVRMIVAGFFQQIFDRITIDSVRDALGHAISRRVRETS